MKSLLIGGTIAVAAVAIVTASVGFKPGCHQPIPACDICGRDYTKPYHDGYDSSGGYNKAMDCDGPSKFRRV